MCPQSSEYDDVVLLAVEVYNKLYLLSIVKMRSGLGLNQSFLDLLFSDLRLV